MIAFSMASNLSPSSPPSTSAASSLPSTSADELDIPKTEQNREPLEPC